MQWMVEEDQYTGTDKSYHDTPILPSNLVKVTSGYQRMVWQQKKLLVQKLCLHYFAKTSYLQMNLLYNLSFIIIYNFY